MLTPLTKITTIVMGIAERKQRQMDAVRSTILDQSWQIVAEEGWQALSIRKIADAIEYSTPVIYKHFENKNAIIEEFTRQGYALLAAELNLAKAGHPNPAQQLVAMSHTYWDFAFANEKYYQIMFGLGIPTCDMIHAIDEMKQVSDAMLGSIKETIAGHRGAGADEFLKLRTFWSILHGLVAIDMLSANQKPEISRQTLDDAIAGFIKALKT